MNGISAILTLVSGIGIFLIACSQLSSNLESLSGDKLKALFAKVSESKLSCTLIGALSTAVIQSSGATSVMVIGFVNAGIITLTQAAAMIFGANIGTTVTGQIVALGFTDSGTISTTAVFSAFAGIGALMLSFAKKDAIKKTGGALSGFGMLFVGLSIMSGSMESFAELDAVKNFLAKINGAAPLVLTGAVFTAIVQSSSVMTSVAITMVVTGLISLNQGIFITMGANIGSCVVSAIAGLTSGKGAKQTALIHLIFNVSGVSVFLLVHYFMIFIIGKDFSFGNIIARLFPGAVQTQLAMFHTFFNVITVILILPFTDKLVSAVTSVIHGNDIQKSQPKLHYVNRHMLKTPPLAVQQVKNEVANMADIAIRNWELSLHIICTQDFSQIENFRTAENELNYINRELVKYIIILSEGSLSKKDHIYLSTALRSVSDLERIGDYAENVVEYAENLKNAGDVFSDKAIIEIDILKQKNNLLFRDIMNAYTTGNYNSMRNAEKTEDEIDFITDKMADNHLSRLSEKICTPNAGAQYLSLASDAERVADHLINVGKAVKYFA